MGKATPGQLNAGSPESARPEAGFGNRRSKHRAGFGMGFTLLEVLVVVAVLALLMAILMPSLQRVRAQARRVACQSNLRQLAVGWQNYLEANEGKFFKGIGANYLYGGRQGLGGPMFRVPKPLNRHLNLPLVATQGTEVFQCPEDVGDGPVQPSFYEYIGTSYDTNPYLVGAEDAHVSSKEPCKDVLKIAVERSATISRDRVANESRVPLLGDLGWVEGASYASTKTLYWHHTPGAYNLAFMDGHASFVRIRKGLHATGTYTLLPFADLQRDACECQIEKTWP